MGSIFIHLPSFSKLNALKIDLRRLTAKLDLFAPAAFGLAPEGTEPLMGTLKNLRSLSFNGIGFLRGERAPLVNAIVRTCSQLKILSLPGDANVSEDPQDIKEYDQLILALSTLKDLEQLTLPLGKPFVDWSPLRSARKLRRIFFTSPSFFSTMSKPSDLPLCDHTLKKNLGFAEIFAGAKPLCVGASAEQLGKLLDMYQSNCVSLGTSSYQAFCFEIIENRIPHLLRHPLIEESSRAVPETGFTDLGMVPNAVQRLDSEEDFFLAVSLEKRFHDLLRASGRVPTLQHIEKSLRWIIKEQRSLRNHKLMLAAFPLILSPQERFRLYMFDERWVQEMHLIVSNLESIQDTEQRDKEMSDFLGFGHASRFSDLMFSLLVLSISEPMMVRVGPSFRRGSLNPIFRAQGVFRQLLPHFARLGPKGSVSRLFNHSLSHHAFEQAKIVLDNEIALPKLNMEAIDVQFLSHLLERNEAESHFQSLITRLPDNLRRQISIPSFCARDPSALKLALDYQMHLSHSGLVSLFEAAPSTFRDHLWEHYLRLYPSITARTSGVNLAVNRCLVDLLKRFFSAGVDLESTDELGSGPLHHLGGTFNAELVPLLILYGAKVNQVNAEGLTPLLVVVGDPDINRLYLDALAGRGADVLARSSAGFNIFTIEATLAWVSWVAPSFLPSLPEGFVRTASPSGGHLFTFLLSGGRIDAIKRILQTWSSLDWDIGSPSIVASLLAHSSGLSACVFEYVCSGPIGREYAMSILPTLFRRLSAFPRPSEDSVLAILGLCGNAIDTPDDGGQTPLLQACAAGMSSVVQTLLLKGANPLSKGPQGASSLLVFAIAAAPTDTKVAESILAAVGKSAPATSFILAEDGAKRNAWTVAIEKGNYGLLQVLMNATEWPPEVIRCVLFAAANHAEALALILEHLSITFTSEQFKDALRLMVDEKLQWSILELVCSLGNTKAVAELLKPAYSAFDIVHLNSALRVVSQIQQTHSFSTWWAISQSLISAGADPRSVSSKPFDSAAASGTMESRPIEFETPVYQPAFANTSPFNFSADFTRTTSFLFDMSLPSAFRSAPAEHGRPSESTK